MAVTKIHPINKTLKKAIDYILNPDKTNNKFLSSTFMCSKDFASEEMLQTIKESNSRATVLARHLIQSFAPGETTPEQAHEIGRKLADTILDGKYEYVIATHIDRQHIHNHIIFNNVSYKTRKGYISNKRTYHKIRYESDKLCRKYNLSVIDEFFQKRRGKTRKSGAKSYKEYQSYKRGNSWKERLRNDIDESIFYSKDFNQFIKNMREKGYEIKFGKHIAFKHKDKEKYIRSKSLGEDYTEITIRDRIKNKISKEEFEFNIEKRKNSELDYTFDNIENNFKKAEFNKMIDTKTDKYQAKENGGLKYWADIRNLKDMVKTVDFLIEMNIHSKEDLEEKINEFKGKKTEIFTNYKELEKDFTNEINNLKVLNVYQKYKFIYEESLKEDTSDEFRDEYKNNILEFQKAKEYLTALYGENFPSDEELINKIEEIESEKKSLDDDLDKINQDISNLYVAYSNYDLIRGSSR